MTLTADAVANNGYCIFSALKKPIELFQEACRNRGTKSLGLFDLSRYERAVLQFHLLNGQQCFDDTYHGLV